YVIRPIGCAELIYQRQLDLDERRAGVCEYGDNTERETIGSGSLKIEKGAANKRVRRDDQEAAKADQSAAPSRWPKSSDEAKIQPRLLIEFQTGPPKKSGTTCPPDKCTRADCCNNQ